MKVEVVSSHGVVSSRFKILECGLPQTEIIGIEVVSSKEVVSS